MKFIHRVVTLATHPSIGEFANQTDSLWDCYITLAAAQGRVYGL